MSDEGVFYPQLAYPINLLERYGYEYKKYIFINEVYRSIKYHIHNPKALLLQHAEIKFMLCNTLTYPMNIQMYKIVYSKILQEVYRYSKKDADVMIKDALDCLATQ